MIIWRETCKCFHYCGDILVVNKKFFNIYIILLASKYFFVSFQELTEKVHSFITKQTTKFRTPVPAEERLAISLQYLLRGETYESVIYQFRIHRTTVSQIIKEVCSAIYKVLETDYMKVSSFRQELKTIADEGYHR